MKLFWSRFFKVCAGVAVLGGIGVAAYLQHSLFGKLPSGERLARIERSPNYAGGVFRNQINTPLRTTDQSEWSMWMETVFAENGQSRPPGTVPAGKTDLKALDPVQDLVVWLGHSSYYVQLGRQRILIDPVFSNNASPVPWTNTAFDGTSLYSADDMPPIDVLLISHDHYDHLDYSSILAQLRLVKQVVARAGRGGGFRGLGLRHAACA
ncbi:MBL fold metallo-hydrolase [Variovorax sp. WS11]|uniref:MBL fold metallo-hydrolase n=1 Tax=Variovorax sp. WS11 TaxID=1105204 RepID=UPI001C62B029|nr:MBL fold metallo-hydrolase [Variovorax sp. WS11]